LPQFIASIKRALPKSHGGVQGDFGSGGENTPPLPAGAGGAALGLLASAAARRGRGVETLVVLAAMAGWVAAQSMNAMAWQRYFGPLALIFAMLLVALVIAGESRRARPGWRGWWLGPAALIALQLAVSALTLLREVAAGERLPAM